MGRKNKVQVVLLMLMRHGEGKNTGGISVAKTWRKKAEYRWYLLMLLRYGETKQSSGGTNVGEAWGMKAEYRWH